MFRFSLCISVGLAMGLTSPSGQSQLVENGDLNLKGLATLNKPFKGLPYMRAAIRLQNMKREEALGELEKLAKERDEGGQVIVLCRMLFSNKVNSTFRAPRLGNPVCLGETNSDDWPLVPIEVIDGIPFFVVIGYELGGVPEGSLQYLKYCIKNCKWSATRFGLVTEEARKKTLKKLLASKKWKVPLSTQEIEFLSSQNM